MGRPRQGRHRHPGTEGTNGADRERGDHRGRRPVRSSDRVGRQELPGGQVAAGDRHRRPSHGRHARCEEHRPGHLPVGRLEVAGLGLQRLCSARQLGDAADAQPVADRLGQGGAAAQLRGRPCAVRGIPGRDPGQGLRHRRRRDVRVPVHREQPQGLRRPLAQQPVEPFVRAGARHQHDEEPTQDLLRAERRLCLRHPDPHRHATVGRADR